MRFISIAKLIQVEQEKKQRDQEEWKKIQREKKRKEKLEERKRKNAAKNGRPEFSQQMLGDISESVVSTRATSTEEVTGQSSQGPPMSAGDTERMPPPSVNWRKSQSVPFTQTSQPQAESSQNVASKSHGEPLKTREYGTIQQDGNSSPPLRSTDEPEGSHSVDGRRPDPSSSVDLPSSISATGHLSDEADSSPPGPSSLSSSLHMRDQPEKSILIDRPATPSSSPPNAATQTRLKSLNQIITLLVREAQRPESPTALGSLITGKRNQLDSTGDPPVTLFDDLNEYRMRNAYLREGHDRIGVLPEGWKEVTHANMESNSHKRSRDEMEVDEDDTVQKKRKLKSEICPAKFTSWKPAWLDKVQCYPVNQLGEDMSNIACLRGDEIYRNASKMQHILETECMYIPSHRIDELVEIAKANYASLKAVQGVYGNAAHPKNKIRIERYQFM